MCTVPGLGYDKAKIEEANERKNQKIREAIANGAKVEHISGLLSADEMETLISIDSKNNVAIIDTSEQKIITKCLKRNWEIIGITYNSRDSIAAMKFKGPAKKISIMSL